MLVERSDSKLSAVRLALFTAALAFLFHAGAVFVSWGGDAELAAYVGGLGFAVVALLMYGSGVIRGLYSYDAARRGIRQTIPEDVLEKTSQYPLVYDVEQRKLVTFSAVGGLCLLGYVLWFALSPDSVYFSLWLFLAIGLGFVGFLLQLAVSEIEYSAVVMAPVGKMVEDELAKSERLPEIDCT